MKTEKQKYLEWLEDQVQNHGLISTHVSRNSVFEDITSKLKSGDVNIIENYNTPVIENEEEYYAELNRMIDAPRLEDPEIFPNGTSI